MGGWDEFSAIYDDWTSGTLGDIPFYVELAAETEGPLVELGVGSGRVAVPVARQTGRQVLGLDSSPGMLELARARCAAAGADVELRLEDITAFRLEEPAGLVYCPFRTLNHLPTWADRRRTFASVAAALAPGGRFAWNAFVYDAQSATRDHGNARPRDGGRIWDYVEHFPADSRIDVTAYTGAPGNDPHTISFWWVTRSEWEGLIETSGLEVEALYGWFDRRPFDGSSREFVWVVRRPG